MKLRLLGEIIFISFILIVLMGCGAKPPAERLDAAKIAEFTNVLQTANIDYGLSYILTSQLLQDAVKAGQTPAAQILSENSGYDGTKDYLQNYAHFDQSLTKAENAVDCIEKIDSDFQYLYINCKELPPDFKDDFYNMKNLLNDNVNFIKDLQQGQVDKDSLQAWMDGTKKIEDSYNGITLEIQRLNK